MVANADRARPEPGHATATSSAPVANDAAMVHEATARMHRILFEHPEPSEEEEDPVLAHACDPHKRVDVAPSSRRVTIAPDGQTIADSRRPLLLFETTLPVRYYLPAAVVRMDLLTEGHTTTACPWQRRRALLVGPHRRCRPRGLGVELPGHRRREPPHP